MRRSFTASGDASSSNNPSLSFTTGRYSSFTPTVPVVAIPAPKRKNTLLLRLLIGAGVLYGLWLGGGWVSHTVTAHTVAANLAPTKPQTICLDPGHGGDDPGATSTDGSINERDINLQVAQQVEQQLQADGYKVYMTRTTNDETLSNRDRYTYCNNQHATIMVSIHHNDYSDTTVDYATALFYKDEDQALASSILNSVSTKLQITNDNIAQFEDGVLSESAMPAALSEGFFITSDSEYDLLTQSGSTRLADEASGITAGIVNYFTQPKSAQPAINNNPQVIERDDG